MFDWFAKTKSDFLDFDLRKVFIDIPRIDLLPNISKRTELMFKKNCLKEVKKFNTMRLNKSLSANKLIGVQEINQFFKDSISLEECKEYYIEDENNTNKIWVIIKNCKNTAEKYDYRISDK